MRDIVIAPTYSIAEYWCAQKGIAIYSALLVVPNNGSQYLRGINLAECNVVVIAGEEYDYPEMTLNNTLYSKFRELLDEVNYRLGVRGG